MFSLINYEGTGAPMHLESEIEDSPCLNRHATLSWLRDGMSEYVAPPGSMEAANGLKEDQSLCLLYISLETGLLILITFLI